MEVMLDFHYSDFWADPSRQWKPEAWNGVEETGELGDSLYQYTYAILTHLVLEGLAPAIVQVGNEINGNILIERTSQAIDGHSPGMYPVDWSRQVALLQRAIEAVEQVNAEQGTTIRSLVHVAQPDNAEHWFPQASAAGLNNYDIIGLSYYPEWSDYSIRELGDFVAFLVEEYGKEVMIVEAGYPWTFENNDRAGNVLGWDSKLDVYGNQVSQEIQRDFLTELSWLVRENGGTGLVYWEPAWVSTGCSSHWGVGSHYDNATLFDFNNKLHPGADYLGWNYNQIPPGLENRQVVFQVNMKQVEPGNGVYVTGDFTGDPWQFIPMFPSGEDWYSLDTLIPGRSSGAYIFYKHNDWNEVYREEVPSACAEVWGSHRKYLVSTENLEYAFAWSSCSISPVGIENAEGDLGLIYLPDEGIIQLEREQEAERVLIADVRGSCSIPDLRGNQIDVSYLGSGMHILFLDGPQGTCTFKFIR